ncbi:MAG: hypothetical protein PHV06_12530 [bacterium]|nr:hypothetical protein [bacterium]
MNDNFGIPSQGNNSIPPVPPAAPPTPLGLIAVTWLLCVCTFIPYIGIIFLPEMFICAIILIASKNKTGKINGLVALSIGIINFLIASVLGFIPFRIIN